jgi:beta-glucanase (GH16 family)
VKLDPGTAIEQTITGLAPNTMYTLSGKFKIGTGTPVTMTVKNHGATAKSVAVNLTDSDATNTTTGAFQWVLRSLTFTTGTSATSATITVSNATTTGTDYCDEIAVVPYTLPNGFRLNPGRYLTASAVQSTNRPVYGYYEARMKAANAASSSAFWFQAPLENGQRAVELDVCEVVGNPIHVPPQFPNYDQLVPINTHYFPAGGDYNNPFKHNAGSRLADNFHVYGVDWQADQIIFYLDGVEIHRITQLQPPLVPTANGQTQVQRLKWLLFDTEIFSYYGIPAGSSDFQVDYIRAWTK